jgi:hypothetical protein
MNVPPKLGWLLRNFFLACIALTIGCELAAARDVAIVTIKETRIASANSGDLSRIIKTTHKWADGHDLIVVLTDPSSPEMRIVAEKLLSLSSNEFRKAIESANKTRLVFVVVANDDEAIKTLRANPTAIALVNVYSINSGVDVWKIDGKLPLEPAYLLHSQ